MKVVTILLFLILNVTSLIFAAENIPSENKETINPGETSQETTATVEPPPDQRPGYPSPQTNYDNISWFNHNNNMGYQDPKKENWDVWIVYDTNAIQRNSRYAPTYFHRGMLYDFKGDHRRAVSDYTQAILIDPNYGSAYANRAVAYFYLQDYDKSWGDVSMARSLRSPLDAAFLEWLKKESRRDR